MKSHHRREKEKKKERKEIVGQSGLIIVVVITNIFTPLKYPKNKKKNSQTTKILKKMIEKITTIGEIEKKY